MEIYMKHIKLLLISLLILSLLAFAGCGGEKAEEPETPADGETPSAGTETTDTDDTGDTDAYDYSQGIDVNGKWEGVTALDNVELCQYMGIEVPSDVHTIADADVEAQIADILSSFAEDVQVTDRAIVDGDTVNIDYVGSVDGVEFEGGSTQGNGTTVTIGVTSYIDDFLEQLIGHTPGENFDIEVTFPDPYPNNTDLSGKDAVFNITVNYITESVTPELTDDFVSEKLAAQYGWTTVEDMQTSVYNDLRDEAVKNYLQQYIEANSTVTTVPDTVLDYVQRSMINYFNMYAGQMGMELEDFLTSYTEYESVEDVYEQNREGNLQEAGYFVILQAIAEKEGITAKPTDVEAYFADMGVDDYSPYEEYYGMPYLMQSMLFNKVVSFVAENAVLAD